MGQRSVEQRLIVHFSGRCGLQNADFMTLQIIDRSQRGLRRRKQHGGVPAHDQHGLTARRHRDIAAHDGKLRVSFFERARGLRETLDRNQLEANGFAILGELLGRGRKDCLIIAVARNGDSQDSRPLVVVNAAADSGDRSQDSDSR